MRQPRRLDGGDALAKSGIERRHMLSLGRVSQPAGVVVCGGDLPREGEEEQVDLASPDDSRGMIGVVPERLPDLRRGVRVVRNDRPELVNEQSDRIRACEDVYDSPHVIGSELLEKESHGRIRIRDPRSEERRVGKGGAY